MLAGDNRACQFAPFCTGYHALPAHLAAALSCWELSRLCEEPRPAHELIVLEEALDLRQEAFVDSFQPWT